MLEDAVWLWDHVPLLPYVEFPWRLLQVAALSVAMLAAALGPALDTLGKWRNRALAAVLALLIVPNLFHLSPPGVADVDLALWTPGRMAASGFESTTMGEVAPRWMANAPPPGMAASVMPGGGQVKEELRAPFAYRARLAASRPVRVRLPYAWYPGWEVRVDGRPTEAGPAAGSGLVEFAAPPGSHEIDLRFGRTWDRALGEAISLLAAIALAGSGRWRRKAPNRPVPAAASAG